jgi:hypothetical protein
MLRRIATVAQKIVQRSSNLASQSGRKVTTRNFSGSFKDKSINNNGKPFSSLERVEENAEMLGVVDIMKEVARQQQDKIAYVIPWFISNMPPAYFRNVPEHIRIDQMKAIMAINDLSKHSLYSLQG